jgi:hypothetical protein
VTLSPILFGELANVGPDGLLGIVRQEGEVAAGRACSRPWSASRLLDHLHSIYKSLILMWEFRKFGFPFFQKGIAAFFGFFGSIS